MDVAKCGKVHAFCMPNAVLTFKEYLLDYAGDETLKKGNILIKKEFDKLNENIKPLISRYLERIENGERDLRV